MEQTLRPLEPPFEDGIGEILDKYPKQDGYLLKLFRVFANSERFLRKGMPNLLDRESPLSMRDRELVILRICANNGCEYEWGVHVAIFAKYVKLSESQVAATAADQPIDSDWSDTDRLLLQVIDELCHQGALQADTKEAFRSHWSKEQQLEIFALAGSYHTVSFVANNSDLPLEEFAARFPA